MPCRSAAPDEAIRWPAAARPPMTVGPSQPGLGWAATPTGLSTTTRSSSSCRIRIPSTGRGATGSPGGGGSSTSSQLPPASRSPLPRTRPSTTTLPASARSAAADRERPNSRDSAWSTRCPSSPSGTGRARCIPAELVTGPIVTCAPGRTAQAASAAARSSAREPSNSIPRRASTTPRTPPQTIAESATLKTGQTLPSGPKTDRKSTTPPRRKPGSRKIRSVRLPSAPPRTSPSVTAQPVENSRRAVRTMTTATATATRVNRTVKPSAKEKAAPVLRRWVRYSAPPRSRMSSPGSMVATTISFVTRSVRSTAAARASSSRVRGRRPETGTGVSAGSGCSDRRCSSAAYGPVAAQPPKSTIAASRLPGARPAHLSGGHSRRAAPLRPGRPGRDTPRSAVLPSGGADRRGPALGALHLLDTVLVRHAGELGTGLRVPGQVVAGRGIEDVHLAAVEPELRLPALADPAGGVDRDDRLGAQLLGVQLTRQVTQLVGDRLRRLVRDVGELRVAQPLGDVHPRPEDRAERALGLVDERGVLEVLGPDPDQQQVTALDGRGTLVVEVDVPEGRRERVALEGRRQEVHRRRADEAGHEQVDRLLVELPW